MVVVVTWAMMVVGIVAETWSGGMARVADG